MTDLLSLPEDILYKVHDRSQGGVLLSSTCRGLRTLYHDINIEIKKDVEYLIEKVSLSERYRCNRNCMVAEGAVLGDNSFNSVIDFYLESEQISLERLLSDPIGLVALGNKMSDMMVHWQFTQETISAADDDLKVRFARLQDRWAYFRNRKRGEVNHVWRIWVTCNLPVCKGRAAVHDLIVRRLYDEYTKRLLEYVERDAKIGESFRIEVHIKRGSGWRSPWMGLRRCSEFTVEEGHVVRITPVISQAHFKNSSLCFF